MVDSTWTIFRREVAGQKWLVYMLAAITVLYVVLYSFWTCVMLLGFWCYVLGLLFIKARLHHKHLKRRANGQYSHTPPYRNPPAPQG